MGLTVAYYFYNKNFIVKIKHCNFSGECKKSSNEMKGDLAIIKNIRKNEKNEVVGDTLYMVGTLTDPQVNMYMLYSSMLIGTITDPQVHVVQLKYNFNKEC